MDVARFLDAIRCHDRYAGQLTHVEQIPPRAGRYAATDPPLPSELVELLSRGEMHALYLHQAEMLQAAREGQDCVLVTGTASGKTLGYNLPILERCLTDKATRALYLYPTKALAQDQQKGLRELLGGDPLVEARIASGVYDGDTPVAQRRRIMAEANLVLSNPDMLHASILPYHPKWHRFFSSLAFVVLDEVHTYRGILGAHVACVLRRLARVCEHYGSRPVFLAASATIANPGELASKLIGRSVRVIDDDGSPRGRKFFALWNPRAARGDILQRSSATDDAVWLMVEAMEAGGQTLAFTRTRQAAELIQRFVHQSLTQRRSPLAHKVRAYRGGYLPQERRGIEAELFQGKLCGVAATNALELGVDIGTLDVALLVHYPGTIASTWQQAGRSGRRRGDSLAIMLAGNDPVDQYLLRHPDYFFAQSPEHAVVDPENPYVLAKHLQAAAFELPLDEPSLERFGPPASAIADILCQAEQLSSLAGKAYYSGEQNPAQRISLRHMSDNTYSIVLQDPAGNQANQVIANVDAISAPELVYPEAVYLHNGLSYLVRELDLNGKVAYVQRHEMDYYTQAVLESHVLITHQREQRSSLPTASERHRTPTARLAYGDVDVRWKTVGFKKIKFTTRENVGYGPVNIPEQTLSTTAFWLTPDELTRRQISDDGFRISEGVCGLRNLAVVCLPMVAMCDSRDISGVVDSKNLGQCTLILYDRYPGGLGYSEKGFQHIEDLLRICHQIVSECPCEQGCPSCVGLPNLRPAIHSDPDLTRGYPVPDKAATLRLLELLRRARSASDACYPKALSVN